LGPDVGSCEHDNETFEFHKRKYRVFRAQADCTFILPSEFPAKELLHLPEKNAAARHHVLRSLVSLHSEHPISWSAERLSASQKRLFSMKLISCSYYMQVILRETNFVRIIFRFRQQRRMME
jgi:hypothetical protein